MNREAFKNLSDLRLGDARRLLSAKRYAGAYYLMGYAVECALKACVAKQVKQYDFPDKKLAQEAFTHDLQRLVKVAGLAPDLEGDRKASKALDLNWAVGKTGTNPYDMNWPSAKRRRRTCSRRVQVKTASCRGLENDGSQSTQ